jgi:hypothetical protein
MKIFTDRDILGHPIEVERIPKELGGGWDAYCAGLGRWAFHDWGRTPQEALRNLLVFAEQRLQDYQEEGIDLETLRNVNNMRP